MKRFAVCTLLFAALASGAGGSGITIDYPENGSLFPRDFTAPTFLWRDSQPAAKAWRIEVKFSGGAKPLRFDVPGTLLQVGAIDERAIAPSNELPKLTPEQAATHTWIPDKTVWEAIKAASIDKTATITFRGTDGSKEVSEGTVAIMTSADPVGAPVFFRDVPLMPATVEKGVIKPLPKSALPLVAWRLRYVNETRSRTLMENLPTCANCHSFSRDGKTLGLDMDGPQNDKGLYALVPISREMTIRKDDVIAWSSFRGKLGGKIRVGFMSQVSPDGKYVVTMVNGSDVGRAPANGLPKDVQGNFYVSNFKDYRFLQVFYPTRGILAWYSRETGKLQPLPGADDPDYVHTNATWSPDGKYLIFARAKAREPYPPGTKLAARANDPEETPVQYDLYRIPFNGGKGGVAEPVPGASANGKSNSFAKISPDGRWIVWTQARNGLLMRPDGKLYIMPAAGGTPRLMRANTPLMNSWHSFSPNGKWLVFSSKSRSPYTQMYLTHIDENGNDSPAILVENATAANRAVNIPEFVNIGPDAWAKIDPQATEFYRLTDNAVDMLQAGKHDAALTEFRKLVEMDPADTTALNNLGAALTEVGQYDEALRVFEKALEVDPDSYKAYSNQGVALGRMGRFEEAEAKFQKALEISPDDAKTHSAYGGMLFMSGRPQDAMPHLTKALDMNPGDTDAHNNVGGILAREGRFAEAIPHFEQALEAEPKSMALHFNLGRALAANGSVEEGIRHIEQALEYGGSNEFVVLDRLARLYADAGRFGDAAGAAKRALPLAEARGQAEAAGDLRTRIAEYESKIGK